MMERGLGHTIQPIAPKDRNLNRYMCIEDIILEIPTFLQQHVADPAKVGKPGAGPKAVEKRRKRGLA